MKIIHFIYSLGNGGAEKFTVELSNELSKKNDIYICSFSPIENWMIPPTNIQSSVKLIKLNIKRKYSILGLIRLLKVLNEYRPDVVHIHSSILMFYFIVLSLLFTKCRYIQTVHNTVTPGYNKLFDILKFFPIFSRSLINVCLSESIHDLYCREFPRFIFKRIENGIQPLYKSPQYSNIKREINKLKKDANNRVFIAIGNYSIYKNFPLLVRIFKNIANENLNVFLLLIGEDTTPNKRNYLLVEKEKGSNTYLLGLKTNVPDYLYCSDALIISSTKEGLPLVVLEALSLGLPIVSTPVGGVSDVVVDCENGFLASDFSESGLTRAIINFLHADSKKIIEMKKRNRLLFKTKYSIEICARNYQSIYYRNLL